MKALVLREIGRLEVEERPVPETLPGEALVKVAACGVCGSDIPRIFENGAHRMPLVCGHEFAGTIAGLGSGVDGLALGDKVAVFPLRWCGRCAACEAGRYVQCSDYDYYGSRRDGGFAEYVSVPKANLIKVPAGVSMEEADMTEPAAVALHAAKRSGAGVGAVAAVFGCGAIGLMTAQWLRAMGASKVILFDVATAKLELARRLGFELAFDSRAVNPVDEVERVSGGSGADAAVDAAGVPVSLLQAMGCAASGGNVVILGNPSAPVTMAPELISKLMRREVSLHGVWNSEFRVHGGGEWAAALHAMASRRLDLTPLISHAVGLDDAADAICGMRGGKMSSVKVLVKP